MNERIRELRLSLGLSAEKFGSHVGVTRSAISRIENGVVNVTEQMIRAICREFNVNRAWLTEGVGEMFVEIPETILDELALQFDLSDKEKGFISSFCRFPKEKRNVIMEFLRHD